MIMKLKRITNSKDDDAVKLIALHEDVFPETERYRDTQILINLIDKNESVHFNAIYEEDKLAGLFLYWDLGGFYYIHFLAVYSEMRNRQIGKQVLDWVAANLKKPVFLEVEAPADDLQTRRLHFYERNGYRVVARNPELLYEARERSSILWMMANQQVEHPENYIQTIKDIVYDASVE